jgi:hypothetical protein
MLDCKQQVAPPAAPLEELRKATRFVKEPDTEFAVVQVEPGVELLAEVRDESLFGLGLIVSDVGPLEIGQQVTIIYRREVLDAIVRNASPRPNGTFQVGFECRRNEIPRDPTAGSWCNAADRAAPSRRRAF